MNTFFSKLKGFNNKQKYEVDLGLQRGLTVEEVSFYARPIFDSDQMAQIRAGFEAKLPIGMIELYAKPSMPWQDMKKLRLELTRAQRKREKKSTADLVTACPGSPAGCPDMRDSIVTSDMKKQLDAVDANAWGKWAEKKQVFMFDKNLVPKILDNFESVELLESSLLTFFPYRAALLLCPLSDNSELKIFCNLTPKEKLELYILRDNGESSMYTVSIQEEKKIGEIIAQQPVCDKSEIRVAIQLYICLCAACNKNMEATSECVSNSDLIDVYLVTYQEIISKQHSDAQEKETSLPKKAYMRKAHWHRYWVGPRNSKEKRHIVLRWIPEITVNSPGKLSIRISLVKRPAAYITEESNMNVNVNVK